MIDTGMPPFLLARIFATLAVPAVWTLAAMLYAWPQRGDHDAATLAAAELVGILSTAAVLSAIWGL